MNFKTIAKVSVLLIVDVFLERAKQYEKHRVSLSLLMSMKTYSHPTYKELWPICILMKCNGSSFKITLNRIAYQKRINK